MFSFALKDQWFTAVVLLIGTLLLTITGALLRFDYVFYDLGQNVTTAELPDDIVIVAIDERSMDALGKWPWTRETHASLLKQINRGQPKAVAFDILFAEPDQQHPKDDLLFAQAISDAGNVVLPMVVDAPAYLEGSALLHQGNALFSHAAGAGRVNLPMDEDGIARGIYFWETIAQADRTSWQPHFAYTILKIAGESVAHLPKPPTINFASSQVGEVLQHAPRKIQFYGKTYSFPRVSYVDVWLGRVAPAFFDNKIVLIGATATGMGDFVATPLSKFADEMPGVEYNANVLAAMRDDRLITEMPVWLNALLAMCLVVVPVLWLPNQTPLRALLLNFVYAFLLLGLATVFPYLLHQWFKPSALLFMVLLAYPIWSWRRLDRAHAHLNVELQQLKEDLMEFGLQPDQVVDAQVTSRLRDDLLQSRIAQVRYASQLLRDLQHKKNETLAFISHDLRMPLATAMMMMNDDQYAAKKDRVIAMLEQANQLAESFLSISKAETLNAAAFKELELSGLLQEAVDNIYQIARKKEVKVTLQLPEMPVWVDGDFTLLHRACVNLLSNAIKFSDAGGVVEVNLSQRQETAMISIKDYGVGIPADKLDHVFVKFKRLEGQPVMQGTGLGLYFVDVTVKKHQGNVSVNSVLGEWTAFMIALPALDFADDMN